MKGVSKEVYISLFAEGIWSRYEPLFDNIMLSIESTTYIYSLLIPWIFGVAASSVGAGRSPQNDRLDREMPAKTRSVRRSEIQIVREITWKTSNSQGNNMETTLS